MLLSLGMNVFGDLSAASCLDCDNENYNQIVSNGFLKDGEIGYVVSNKAKKK